MTVWTACPNELTDCLDHIKIAEKLDRRGYSTKKYRKSNGAKFVKSGPSY